MRISRKKAIVAGLAGTFLFDLVGLIGTSLMGDPVWWDIPALLSDKLGLPFAAGVLAHYANGSILAVLYAAVAPSLWGPRWARALTFVTVETVLGVWLFMAPLLGMGIAGVSAMGPMFAVMSLMRHWAYGVPLALLVPVSEGAHASTGPVLNPVASCGCGALHVHK